jgi:hypothetical protein
MAELQQVGALEPAAQEKLMADLRQTDPNLWPLVLQQFRATAAYRRRSEDRETATSNPSAAVGALASTAPLSDSAVARLPPVPSPVPGPGSVASQDTAASTTKQSTCTGTSCATGIAAAPAAGPVTSPKHDVALAQPPGGDRPASGPTSGVVPASYDAPAKLDWQTHLAEAIRQLESESKGTSQDAAEISRQAGLRMLYLLTGRREDALRPIPTVAPALQDFWSKELYGLATWLDAEKTPDDQRRAGEAKRILGEALARLGEAAPLTVNNLAFCTAVQSYGAVTPFKKCEFVPDQEVLLYAEVDNFTAEPTPKGFHTSLRSSYQIFDSRGQRVAEHEFSSIEEHCQNPRRDFFIGYHLRLPKRIYSGKHTLKLTVEDLKSHRVGESSIDLVIKGGDEG